MESRLKEHDSLSCVSRTIEGTWIRSMIVPQKCDEKGNLSTVLLAISDVTEEKEHELEQDRILRFSILTLPLSILLISSTSLIRLRRCLPDLLIFSR